MIFPSTFFDFSSYTDLEYPYIFFISMTDWCAFVSGEETVDFPGRRNLDYVFKHIQINDALTSIAALTDRNVEISDQSLAERDIQEIKEKFSYDRNSVHVITISYKSQELAVMMRLLLN